MPNISETSVSDMSLSPAWSVMIIFLLVDRSSTRVFVPAESAWRPGELAGAPAQEARPGEDLPAVNDLSPKAAAGGH